MSNAAAYPLPPRVAPFAGRILDVDGHEHIPVNLWHDAFGSVTDPFRDALLGGKSQDDAKGEKAVDDTPINAATVFNVKLEQAPGGIDLTRRLDVLDFVGVTRQMIYPGNMGLTAVILYSNADDDPTMFASLPGDRKAYARQMIDTHNQWCARVGRISDRYRAVAVLMGESPDDLLADAKQMIKAGVRAFWMPNAVLPGGVSPAHSSLDPLWALLAAADAPVLSHIGADTGFLKSMAWKNATAFDGWMCGEFSSDPWSLNNIHLATQNFLIVLTMGGVFERHPRLRFGAAEVGAHWIGPMARAMDFWHSHNRKFLQVGGVSPLTMKPSDYIRRNVQISGFDIEDIASYIDQFGLEEIYCFTADFPHREGGRAPIEDFARNLDGKSADVLEKFFVTNGEWLLPP